MTVEQILNQNSTKKEKAFAFYSLGYTRQQVADLLCNGNYGYAHNMWKKWNEIQSTMPLDNVFEFLFNRRFGVEIEFFGAAQSTLERNLRAEGIRYEFERYNHETRNHWKFTTDSSIRGDYPFEMVSPILQGCEGLQSLKKATTALLKCYFTFIFFSIVFTNSFSCFNSSVFLNIFSIKVKFSPSLSAACSLHFIRLFSLDTILLRRVCRRCTSCVGLSLSNASS